MSTIAPARIETRDGRRWWRCPVCGRTLAEVIGNTIAIKSNGREIIARVVQAEQLCTGCLTRSELTPDLIQSVA